MPRDLWSDLPDYLARQKTYKALQAMNIPHDQRKNFEAWHDTRLPHDLAAHCRPGYSYATPGGIESRKGPMYQRSVLGEWMQANKYSLNLFAKKYKRKVFSAYDYDEEKPLTPVEKVRIPTSPNLIPPPPSSNPFVEKKPTTLTDIFEAEVEKDKRVKKTMNKIRAILVALDTDEERYEHISRIFHP